VTLSHDEFAGKIIFSYLPGFLDPAFEPDLLDPAEVVHLQVMGPDRGQIRHGRQERAGEIAAVTAKFHAFGLYTIEGRAPLRQVDMLSILFAAAFAGYFFFRPAVLPLQHFGDLFRQIVLVNFAIETVYSTRRRQSPFVFHGSSLNLVAV
jgi:hypothetical protein